MPRKLPKQCFSELRKLLCYSFNSFTWSVNLNQNSYFFAVGSKIALQPRFDGKSSLWSWELPRNCLLDDSLAWCKSLRSILTQINLQVLDGLNQEGDEVDSIDYDGELDGEEGEEEIEE